MLPILIRFDSWTYWISTSSHIFGRVILAAGNYKLVSKQLQNNNVNSAMSVTINRVIIFIITFQYFLNILLLSIYKSWNGGLGNKIRGMMVTWGIRARMWRIRVWTRRIKVRMQGITVIMQGMGVEIRVYKYLTGILQGFC